MADKNDITFEIMEHIGVIDTIDNREEKWTKEVNVVAWNGGKPKIDVRDWNEAHDRMSRGITLTEDQAMKLTKALVDRFRARVGIANGLFIFFRLREQWIAWYICAALEAVMNILAGQYVLLVLKLGYFTNTTYGYIKWSHYIRTHKEDQKSLL